MSTKTNKNASGFTYDTYKASKDVSNAKKKLNSVGDYSMSDYVTGLRDGVDNYADYVAGQNVVDALANLNNHNANKVGDWTGGKYGVALDNIINQIGNREKFSYSLNGDALYQQYKDQYMKMGNTAMQDTMGKAAALTGGYGNSYALTAGSQAYQSYMEKLNDKIPELYNLALTKYQMDGQDLYNQLGMYQDAYNSEYGQYRDSVNDWYNERNYLTNMYQYEADRDRGIYESDRAYANDRYNAEANREYTRWQDAYDNAYKNYRDTQAWDYGLYDDAYSRAFANYQQGVAESQFAQELALKKAQLNKSSGSGSSSSSKKKTTSGGSTKTSADPVLQYLATTQKDANGRTLTQEEKKRNLLAAGISSQEVAQKSKYVFKDSQLRDRL